MALITDTQLPAAVILKNEGLDVRSPGTPCDRRVALVNLMPLKQDTELDFMRLIAAQPLAVEVVLTDMSSHTCRHTPAEHIGRFYTPSQQLDPQQLSGAIITGAPLERVAFGDVDFGAELRALYARLERARVPMMQVCWAAFARMYWKYGVAMCLTEKKISGIYAHGITSPLSPLMEGVEEKFDIPHSRFAFWRREEIERLAPEVRIVAESAEAGIYMAESDGDTYILGHGEYAASTLDSEYRRDLGKGMNPHIPCNYYPDDDPSRDPADRWSHTARRIMKNWIKNLPS